MRRFLLFLAAVLLTVIPLVQPQASNASGGYFIGGYGGLGTNINISTCTNCAITNVADIPGVTINDSSNDDAAAITTFLKASTTNRTNRIIYFPKGQFDFATSVGAIDNADKLVFAGEPGAKIVKKTGFANEYLFLLRYGKDVTFQGLAMSGLYSDAATTIAAGESGIYCGSCDGFYVYSNIFDHFGDSVVRSATNPSDPVTGINSFNTIIDGNIFKTVFQVTTTSNDADSSHGGTQGFIVSNNIFKKLRGSLKVCSRTDGAFGFNVHDNVIEADPAVDSSVGIELCGVSRGQVHHNTISNTGTWAINFYTNNFSTVPGSWNYGNVNIDHNVISNCKRGIRVQAGTYPNGTGAVVRGVIIESNQLDGITSTDGAYPISTSVSGAGSFIKSGIYYNTLNAIANGLGILSPTGITVQNNN